MRALTLVGDVSARELLGLAREQGLLLTAAGPSALRFTPPLIVTEREIDEALDRTDAMLGCFAAHR